MPDRACLIVIDMLCDFLDRWDEAARDKIIVQTNALISAFRQHGHPIIWVRQEFRADLSDAFLEMRDKQISITIEGTRGAEIHPDLRQQPGDVVILKKRYSAFFNTNLDQTLSELHPSVLVLAGINTHACIRMAAIDAYQRDYRVIIATDCTGSHDDEHARISLTYMQDRIARLSSNTGIISAL